MTNMHEFEAKMHTWHCSLIKLLLSSFQLSYYVHVISFWLWSDCQKRWI